MDGQRFAFARQQLAKLLEVHERPPMFGGQNAGRLSKSFEQLVIVRIPGECFDGVGIAEHYWAIDTVMLRNLDMVCDEWMSAGHNECLLSVNLWNFIDQEVPCPGIRQEGNPRKYQMGSHYNMRPIFGICQILCKLVAYILPNGISVKYLYRGRLG
jgi:hypothetical protein